MSDARCQVQRVPVIKKRDRAKMDAEEKFVTVPGHPGSTTLTPVLLTTKTEVDSEPCVLPPDLLQKLIDSKNLLVVNNSSEIDDELLEGKEELIFIKTIDAPESIKQMVNTSNISVTNAINSLEMPIKRNGIIDRHKNKYETSQKAKEANHHSAQKKKKKFRSDLKKQRKIKDIMDIIRHNKKNSTDEPDSVSAETKNELNKYLENGTKSKKILDIIKFIKQNKKHDGAEKNNTPNININIFKMMKAVTEAVNDTIRTTTDSDSDTIEEKIDLDNTKFNSEKKKSTETVENKNKNINSASVERNIEYNNKKYNLHNAKHNKAKLKSTNINKKSNKAKINKIKLLETNIHSESDSIEDKTTKSKKEQAQKIKYDESDSAQKLSGEVANDTSNVINENSKELSESDEISNHNISKHDKEKDNSDDESDDSDDEIQIQSTHKTDNEQIYQTTLRPKKKNKKDYAYMQGPHPIGGNVLSYEVRNNRRRVKPSTTDRRTFIRKNNVHKFNNRRIINDPKNYWSVPFNILTRKRLENVTKS